MNLMKWKLNLKIKLKGLIGVLNKILIIHKLINHFNLQVNSLIKIFQIIVKMVKWLIGKFQ
jgi:hypothetical protein